MRSYIHERKKSDMKKTRMSNLVQADSSNTSPAYAFIQNGQSISSIDFTDQVDRTLGWLKERGIQRGDAVALWIVNSVEWIALFAAIAKLGAIAVPVNTRYRSEELAHILASSQARILFTHSSYRRINFLEILSAIDASTLPHLKEVVLVNDSLPLASGSYSWPISILDLSKATPLREPDRSSVEDPVILFSTSGTTKAPKLVMHSQRTLVEHSVGCAISLGLDQSDAVMLAMLPMCGVFGLVGVLAAMAGGARIVIQETFEAEEAVSFMSKHQVTHTFGSDEMYRRISENAEGDIPFPHARFFGFGAFTSNFDECAQACVRRGMPLHGLYGSSEVLALFSAQPTSLQLTERLKGGGRPMSSDDASIRVRNTETGELVPTGESGELEIRSSSNFIGYFNNPMATTEAIHEDHFKTGDLGYLRGDGTFVYESRLGDSMRLGGHLVNPMEIEEVIKRIPTVEDAHVVASEIEGQIRAVAFVIPSHPISFDAEEIIQALRKTVAGFKIPARVWKVDSFPQMQGANGLKTSRAELRKIAQKYISIEKSVISAVASE
jgi:fatty-acyl-CoA synthase